MRFLLDTHVWIWGLLAPNNLNAVTQTALIDTGHTLFLSPISIWETFMLIEKQRLPINDPPDRWLSTALQRSAVQEIAVTYKIALRSRQIQLPYQDPADRFIAATAFEYGLTLMTADRYLLTASQIRTWQAV